LEHPLEHLFVDTKPKVPQDTVLQPLFSDLTQPHALNHSSGFKPLHIIKPKPDPKLQILGRPVFALRRKPSNSEIYFVCAEDRGTAAPTETDEHTCLCQLPHGGLGN